MKEPYRTIYFTLVSHNQLSTRWENCVKYSGNGAIYIGDDSNHCTVLEGTEGYHHTEGGTSHNGQHLAYDTLERMLERAEYNPYYYTNKIVGALTWLRDNKVSWG